MLKVRLILNEGQFKWKINFDADLPKLKYWRKMFEEIGGFEFKNPFTIVFAFANSLVCEYSFKFNEALILGPICPNL